MSDDTRTIWSHCTVNCGARCPLLFHVRDGRIIWVEGASAHDGALPDGGASPAASVPQPRPCLRGRTVRRWIESPHRLRYPQRRVGARGEGRFERITWDEALDDISTRLRHTIDTYGNEAVYVAYGTGVHATTGRCFERLVNLLGGHLGRYNDYSTAQIAAAMPYTYGEADAFTASPLIEAASARLIVNFGNSPAETSMGGAGGSRDFSWVREVSGARIYQVDYRLTETCTGHPDEWLPIRPGTDAALVSAIAHELVVNDWIDQDFLDAYTIGFDDTTMPMHLRGQNLGYRDYLLGTGYDGMPKTPEWAAPITQIPAESIRRLARDVGTIRPLFVMQGWGPQRHSNGELTARAIAMLPLLTGQVGLPGTSTGSHEASSDRLIADLPSGPNPVKARISCFTWTDAVSRGTEMTAESDGVRGVDRLSTNIKFIWSYAGNCLTNQHGGINMVHDILVDESLCESIIVTDTVMTDSARYADILLPDVMRMEQTSMACQGESEWYQGVTFGQKVVDAPGECRTSYDVCAALARRFGLWQRFTRERSQEEWIAHLYEEARDRDHGLPSYEDGVAMGHYSRALPTTVALADFRRDPAAHPLSTPSGKAEIFSESLARKATAWKLPEGEVMSPLPIYDAGFEGWDRATDEYPLICAGYHDKARAHSSFGSIESLKQACPHRLWINPIDAQPRGIVSDDRVRVSSRYGTVEVLARVTRRIIPGTVGLAQGAWHEADMVGDRVDVGGCINTLTSLHPSPLAKGNGVHTNLVQVRLCKR